MAITVGNGDLTFQLDNWGPLSMVGIQKAVMTAASLQVLFIITYLTIHVPCIKREQWWGRGSSKPHKCKFVALIF